MKPRTDRPVNIVIEPQGKMRDLCPEAYATLWAMAIRCDDSGTLPVSAHELHECVNTSGAMTSLGISQLLDAGIVVETTDPDTLTLVDYPTWQKGAS